MTSNPIRGGRRYPPYAFTEQGVAMLSSVLSSPEAIAVNIQIMRAFVHLRDLLTSNKELARQFAALESRLNQKFGAIRSGSRRSGASAEGPAQRRQRRVGEGVVAGIGGQWLRDSRHHSSPDIPN